MIDHDEPSEEERVFPDDFSAPCEHCQRPSLGERLCPECECELEVTSC